MQIRSINKNLQHSSTSNFSEYQDYNSNLPEPIEMKVSKSELEICGTCRAYILKNQQCWNCEDQDSAFHF